MFALKNLTREGLRKCIIIQVQSDISYDSIKFQNYRIF